MEDPDYQMALNLQRMYQQESQSQSYSDQNIARKLQAEFEQELIIDKPTNNLVYTKNKNKDSTKSLVDPSWELIDPIPNIYNLFLAFNQQFFWNKLLAVCVEWSKRMTSCAGICSYDGRGGMCKIALSEPLLKLRPRKDLVETLLHEMIHAYLFVTHNNRDRDGHGPEFHKHMYRINNEAGTNITVYHSFHDEVNLYKTHWWKCNGPCVSRKPYYGMIRRATNRAPGPRDFWWAEHSRSCGGAFIKIKEPEKPEKKKSEKENIKPKSKLQNQPGIKSFLTTSQTVPIATQNGTQSKPHSTSQSSSYPSTSQSNIHGFGSTSTPTLNNRTFNNNSNIKNIHGFHDIDKISQKSPVTAGISMNAGTIVINNKPSTINNSNQTSLKNGNRFQGSGVLQNVSTSRSSSVGCSSSSPITDMTTVRNHWLNKFETKTEIASKKRLSGEMIQNTPKRKQNMAKCPNCSTKVPDSEINEHLDICLNLTETCNYCHEEINALELEKHKLTCTKKPETKKSQDLVECNICCEFFDSNDIEKHLETCLQNISMSFETSKDFKECELCKSNIDETIYNTHLASCLLKFYDDIEMNFKSNEEVSCLVCKKFIPKDSLNTHLEDCMSDTVFQSPKEEIDFCNDNSLLEEYDKNVSGSIIISDDSEVFENECERDSFINDNSLIDDYEKSFSS